MARSWPMPPGANTIHFIGDLHYGLTSATRLAKLKADIASSSVPAPDFRVQVGDLIENVGAGQYDAPAVAWMDALMPAVPWKGCLGNHSLYVGGSGTVRSVADSLATRGIATTNYEVDLGFVRVLFLNPADFTDGLSSLMTLSESTLQWLDVRLAADSRDCLVIFHAPPLDSVLGNGAQNSHEPFFAAHPSDTIRSILGTHRNARAFVSGHTHNPIESQDMMKVEVLGGHNVLLMNCSAIQYAGVGPGRWYDRIATPWVTVYGDRLEVRWRDHGAGVWIGPTADTRVTTMAY